MLSSRQHLSWTHFGPSMEVESPAMKEDGNPKKTTGSRPRMNTFEEEDLV